VNPQTFSNNTYTGFTFEFGKTFRHCERKGASKFDRIFWGRLLNIYWNPKEKFVDLIAGILSVCVNIKKYSRYIYAREQRTLCITSRITMKSQAASCELFDNITTEIYNNRCILEKSYER